MKVIAKSPERAVPTTPSGRPLPLVSAPAPKVSTPGPKSPNLRPNGTPPHARSAGTYTAHRRQRPAPKKIDAKPASRVKAKLVTLAAGLSRVQRRRPANAKPHCEGIVPITQVKHSKPIAAADGYDITNPPDGGIANVHVSFHGGALIPNVSLELIFWGNAWMDPATNPPASQVIRAVINMLGGPYMSALKQYGIGPGSLRDAITVLSDPPNPFSRDDWHNLIWDLIDQGTFPEPDDPGGRNLYLIITPPGVNFDTPGVGGAHGYPGDYDFPFDYDNAWAGFVLNDGNIDTITTRLSHELVEACTDPEDDGWTVDGLGPPTDEIGDICQNTTGRVNGVMVQGYWSQYDGVCIIPTAPWTGWKNNDLTQMSNGVPAVPGSSLDGYWGSDNSQHVNFIDGNGHVHELYIYPGAPGWVDNDLTQMSNGVPAAPGSRLDGYWGSDSSQHVNFIDGNGHVHELYIHPGAPGWVDNDLTAMSNGVPAAPGSSLDGYWGSDNSQHVNFIDGNGDVHELFIYPGAPGWADNNLTQMSNNVPAAPGSSLDGYWGSDSSQHVNFIDGNGHVHELYIYPGALGWQDNDLTQMSNGVPAAPGSSLDGYWGSDNSQHVNFIDGNGHVHELYIYPGAPGWVDNDLTQMSSGVPAAPGSSLDGYWGSDNSQHVNFIDGNGDVHELYIYPGAPGWADNDLTVFSSGPTALAGSSLDGYWGSDSSQHVNYLDVAGHVRELYIHPY